MKYKEIKSVFNRLYWLMRYMRKSNLAYIEEADEAKIKEFFDEYESTYKEVSDKITEAVCELGTLAGTTPSDQYKNMIKDLFGDNAPFHDNFIGDFLSTQMLLVNDPSRANALFGKEYGERMLEMIKGLSAPFWKMVSQLNMTISLHQISDLKLEMETFYNDWCRDVGGLVTAEYLFGDSPITQRDVTNRRKNGNMRITCCVLHELLKERDNKLFYEYDDGAWSVKKQENVARFLSVLCGGSEEYIRQQLSKSTAKENLWNDPRAEKDAKEFLRTYGIK